MTYTKKEREDYNTHRGAVCEILGITKNEYNWFRRLGNSLHKVYEDSCNGTVDENEEELVTGRLYGLGDSKAEGLHLHIFYQTDPRGATIYLSNEAIEAHNYYRSGSYCIF